MVKLLQNPLIKTIGIVLILYLALFKDKSNPSSLGNRLSVNNIKKNINEATDKGKFIVQKIDDVEKNKIKPTPKKGHYSVKRANINKRKSSAQTYVIIEDSNIGSGEEILSCGDLATISYQIYINDNEKILSIDSTMLPIGSNLLPILEKNIIGMKKEGIRQIIVPQNSKIEDKNFAILVKAHKSDLKIGVVLHSFKKGNINSDDCF